MKKTDWIDVIGKIDPAYVKEAEQWSNCLLYTSDAADD